MDGLIGALVGAGVGAIAAWIFALDLRERDAKRAYASDLNAAAAAVIEGIGSHSAATQSFVFSIAGQAAAPPPHDSRARLVTAIRLGQMTARGIDKLPFDATFELITGQEAGTNSQIALRRERAQKVLVGWRSGECDAQEAARQISGGSAIEPIA